MKMLTILLALAATVSSGRSAESSLTGAIAGGGGHSSAGPVALVGRVHYVAGQASARAYVRTTVDGASITVANTPGAHELSVEFAAGNLVVSWSAAAVGFVLEEADRLEAPLQWTRCALVPSSKEGRILVTVGQPEGNRIFRLRQSD